MMDEIVNNNRYVLEFQKNKVVYKNKYIRLMVVHMDSFIPFILIL